MIKFYCNLCTPNFKISLRYRDSYEAPVHYSCSSWIYCLVLPGTLKLISEITMLCMVALIHPNKVVLVAWKMYYLNTKYSSFVISKFWRSRIQDEIIQASFRNLLSKIVSRNSLKRYGIFENIFCQIKQNLKDE